MNRGYVTYTPHTNTFGMLIQNDSGITHSLAIYAECIQPSTGKPKGHTVGGLKCGSVDGGVSWSKDNMPGLNFPCLMFTEDQLLHVYSYTMEGKESDQCFKHGSL